MNLQTLLTNLRQRVPAWSHAAFTLPELLITTTLFLLLMAGVVGAHLFGLRMSKITEAKLNASSSARDALGKMTDEIRNCTGIWIGTVTNGSFVALLDGVPQEGSALLVQPTTNAANFIVYFVDPSDQSFRRTTSVLGTTTILAESVTNTTIFHSQDFLGNVLTNSQKNSVVSLSLEFFQYQPLVPVPDYYKVETAVTRRNLEQ